MRWLGSARGRWREDRGPCPQARSPRGLSLGALRRKSIPSTHVPVPLAASGHVPAQDLLPAVLVGALAQPGGRKVGDPVEDQNQPHPIRRRPIRPACGATAWAFSEELARVTRAHPVSRDPLSARRIQSRCANECLTLSARVRIPGPPQCFQPLPPVSAEGRTMAGVGAGVGLGLGRAVATASAPVPGSLGTVRLVTVLGMPGTGTGTSLRLMITAAAASRSTTAAPTVFLFIFLLYAAIPPRSPHVSYVTGRRNADIITVREARGPHLNVQCRVGAPSSHSMSRPKGAARGSHAGICNKASEVVDHTHGVSGLVCSTPTTDSS